MGSVEVAILKAAQEGGYLEQLPETEEEIREEANFFLQEAQKALETGVKGDKTIKTIVNLGKKLGMQEVKEIFGSDQPQLYKGLPVPEDVKHDPTPFPSDFSALGFKEISKLSAEYNAYASRARWMLSVATNKLAGVTHLRDAEFRRAYLAYKEQDAKATDKILDAAARKDEEYQKQDALVRKHAEDVASYKALYEIYGGYVDRLSREWTMRQDEDKRSY